MSEAICQFEATLEELNETNFDNSFNVFVALIQKQWTNTLLWNDYHTNNKNSKISLGSAKAFMFLYDIKTECINHIISAVTKQWKKRVQKVRKQI